MASLVLRFGIGGDFVVLIVVVVVLVRCGVVEFGDGAEEGRLWLFG